MGDLMKCDAVYDEPFWREDGLSGLGGSATTAPYARPSTTARPAGQPGVLLAFVGGSTWKQYGLSTLAARRQAVLQGFAEMFGEKALHPVGGRRRLDQGTVAPRAGPSRSCGPARFRRTARRSAAARPHPLGRHRDRHLLDRLHGRRRPRGRAGVRRGAAAPLASGDQPGAPPPAQLRTRAPPMRGSSPISTYSCGHQIVAEDGGTLGDSKWTMDCICFIVRNCIRD